jgi:hypothetical protein
MTKFLEPVIGGLNVIFSDLNFMLRSFEIVSNFATVRAVVPTGFRASDFWIIQCVLLFPFRISALPIAEVTGLP